MNRQFFIIIAVFLSINNYATSNITGKDTSYAGQIIAFYYQSDPITGKSTLAGEATVKNDGNFSIEINNTDILYLISELGVYKLLIFVEPDSKYNIILPKFREKSEADILNPFFQPIEVHLATTTINQNELNAQIRMFNDAYFPYSEKHIAKVLLIKDFEQLE